MINYAFLYVVNSDKIYTSTDIVCDFDDYANSNIIEIYVDNPYENMFITNKKIMTDIRLINKKTYLFQEFPYFYNDRKAVLVFELNRYEFFKLLYGDIDKSKQNVYIFDKEYNPLFSLQTSLDEFGNIDDYKSKLKGNSGYFLANKIGVESDIYFYSKSPQTNWIYIYPVIASDMKFTFDITLAIVFPFLIIFAIISLIFSFYITMRIYRPINELMLTVTTPINDENAKNEFDLLGEAFKDATFKQEKYNHMMENITPMILERLFSGLINGKELSQESVIDTLNSVNDPLNMKNYYVVVLVSISELLSKDALDVENDFCIISITNIVHSILNNKINHYVLRTSDLFLAVILEFSKEESSINIKKYSIDLCSNIDTLQYINVQVE